MSKNGVVNIKVEKVIFRDDLYPRIDTDVATVQKYAETLDVLPPIELNQRDELIDGWHRWTAHKKKNAATISAIVTQTKSDEELLELAIERNSKFGLQLCSEDKMAMARRIYHVTPNKERVAKKKHLAKILSVGASTLQGWLSRIDKDSKEAQRKRIFDMWLACWTQQEIAADEEMPKGTVDGLCLELADLQKRSKVEKAAAEHATDFEPPIYNVWKQQVKSKGPTHFGNSESRWLDNLLYMYTDPFDVVVDPFGGGGSTVDVCRKRFRRHLVSDRKVEPELEGKITKHDVKDGVLKPPQWKDVKLVYLDPPYWKQAEGQYSKDKADLANMSLDQFNAALAKLIRSYATKLSKAYIALIIQPTQWKSPKKAFTDHVGDMLRAIKLPVEMRYSVPYESQQCLPQQVEWATENKRCLVLTREIVVWRTT